MTTALIPTSQRRAGAVRRRTRRWPTIALLGCGALLVAGAATWRVAAVPALVKFPDDLDERLRYVGTFTQYADATTAAPLPAPAVSALAIERHVVADPDESSASRVVLREQIVTSVQGLPEAVQDHQYVMDRTSHANVADGRAWGFTEANVLDRSGSYRLAFPSGLGVADVTMYSDDIATTYPAEVTSPDDEVDGLDVVAVAASVAATPLTDAYLRNLDQVVALPRSLSFDQLKPSLVAAGIPVDEALATLLTVATPPELATLAAFAAEPIPLQYTTSFTGRSLVEPDTGAIVDVQTVVQRVSARPAGSSVGALRDILVRHREQPAVAAALDGLDALAAEPVPVFEYRYAQTPASVSEMASWVSTQRDRMHLAERTVPIVLVIVGASAVVAGLVLSISRRRRGWVAGP